MQTTYYINTTQQTIISITLHADKQYTVQTLIQHSMQKSHTLNQK